MVALRCIATCYMPSTKKGVKVERYEDIEDDDIYQVPGKRVQEFLETHNFERVVEA